MHCTIFSELDQNRTHMVVNHQCSLDLQRAISLEQIERSAWLRYFQLQVSHHAFDEVSYYIEALFQCIVIVPSPEIRSMQCTVILFRSSQETTCMNRSLSFDRSVKCVILSQPLLSVFKATRKKLESLSLHFVFACAHKSTAFY